jgi:23S rRNA (uracil1939-C5)-methyltransferase
VSALPSRFEFSPLKLVYGGDALGHDQGRTVLVPRVLPGERAEVEETRTAKGVLRARPLRILQAARERVDAPCPYFGVCGGCQYQHLGYESQLSAKREILRETLRRLGKVIWDAEIPVHVGPPWNYRNQAQLKVGRQPDGRVALGFFEAESNRLSPIDACLILSSRLNALLAALRSTEWASRLDGCREVELLADDKDEAVMLTLRVGTRSGNWEGLARDCLTRLPGIVSVATEFNGELRLFGQNQIDYRVGDFSYRISPTSFFQSSRHLLPAFVDSILGEEHGDLALELFSGVGLFTLPLARQFRRVYSVEAHPRASADLEVNARRQGKDNIRTSAQPVYDFLRRFAEPEPDLVIVDPPRAGVGIKTLKLLLATRPKRLLYVSCSPPTLARDLEFLVSHDYVMKSLELFDFFPQTYHIESLVRLTRIDLAHS